MPPTSTPAAARRHVLGLSLACLGLWAHGSVGAQVYTVKDVGRLGTCDATAHGLNNLGQVVGESSDAQYRTYAFVTGPGGQPIRNLGTLPGFANTQPASVARAINDAGVVVGNVGNGAAFVTDAGATTLRRLGDKSEGGVYAWAINASGQVAGQFMVSGRFHAFVTAAGSVALTDLGAFPTTFNDGSTWARGINVRGQVVGAADTYCANGHWCGGFLVDGPGATLQALGVLGDETPYARGNSHAEARAINDRGMIAGSSETVPNGPMHAWVRNGGGLVDLGTAGAVSSEAYGVNNAGQVVGVRVISGGERRGFLWSERAGLVDLNTLIDSTSGWTIRDAVGINDVGQIAANGVHTSQPSCPRALLLTSTVPGGLDLARAEDLFDWAERSYPQFFPGPVRTVAAPPYLYRYYAGSNAYLGLSAGRVLVLGDFTGNRITDVGAVGDFACQVSPQSCTGSAARPKPPQPAALR